MSTIFAITVKDLKLLLRDKAGFFFAFFFPLLMAVFFGSVFSGGGAAAGAMKIYVVDRDGSPESQEFLQRLLQAPELDAAGVALEQAEDGVRRGRRVAYVLIPEGFGESNPFAGKAPKLVLGVDPAGSAEQGMLSGLLNKYAAQQLSETLANPDKMKTAVSQSMSEIESTPIPPEIKSTLVAFLQQLEEVTEIGATAQAEAAGYTAFTPVEIVEAPVAVQRFGPTNPYEISFPQGVVWAILGCCAAFAMSLVIERTRGTLVRLQMAPIERSVILAGKALACFVTSIGLSAVLILLGAVVFGVRPGSPGKLALALVSIAICFVGLMMLLSVLARSEQSAGIGWAVLLIMAMLGGGMIPLFIMPSWMQKLSHLSPVKWSILALEGAIWRGFSYAEMALPCAILVAVGGVTFVLGVRAFRWLT